MDTQCLIDRLAASAPVVRPLPPPWIRVFVWLAVSAPYVALVVFVATPRSDLMAKFAEARFVLELTAAFATGLAAAAAAFASVIPGTDRRLLLLPSLPFAVWLGSIGQGCVSDWLILGLDGLSVSPSWRCFPETVLVSAGPALAMVILLRRGAPSMPFTSVALGALGAAGLGNFGLRFFHPQDASIMILVWQLGSVLLLVILAGWAGRYVLDWRTCIRSALPEGAAR